MGQYERHMAIAAVNNGLQTLLELDSIIKWTYLGYRYRAWLSFWKPFHLQVVQVRIVQRTMLEC